MHLITQGASTTFATLLATLEDGAPLSRSLTALQPGKMRCLPAMRPTIQQDAWPSFIPVAASTVGNFPLTAPHSHGRLTLVLHASEEITVPYLLPAMKQTTTQVAGQAASSAVSQWISTNAGSDAALTAAADVPQAISPAFSYFVEDTRPVNSWAIVAPLEAVRLLSELAMLRLMTRLLIFVMVSSVPNLLYDPVVLSSCSLALHCKGQAR